MNILTTPHTVFITYGDKRLSLSKELFIDRKFQAIGMALCDFIEPDPDQIVGTSELRKFIKKVIKEELNGKL